MSEAIIETLRRLTPRMAGTTFRERTIACIGALLGIGLAGLISGLVAGNAAGLPLLMAPLGASAVLVFAVPASPLAQPWSVVGGNTISAIVGIAIAQAVPETAFAAAFAVAAAIAVMSLTRSLHPPGGAVALSTVLAGSPHFTFALAPVALNSAVLVMLGILYHRFSKHSYPHRPKLTVATTHGTSDKPPQLRVALTESDIDAALAEDGEPFDISREDLQRIVRRAEFVALERTARVPAVGDVMSRDVLKIADQAPWPEAHALLLKHDLRILPVVDHGNRVMGVVELHELDHPAENVAEMMGEAVTASPSDSILTLVDPLTDGRHHAVLVTDEAGVLVGLVTQTDMIVALARLAVSGAARG
jgi:CBS domain-containing membrane protein